jgi:hypothetical protein
LTDDELIGAMFAHDPAVARIAKRIFDKRHAGESVREPAHCDECFEGCPKCQPGTANGVDAAEPGTPEGK